MVNGAQLLLRQAATNQLPDLSYQGFNRLRVFAERGIARDLAPFLARDGAPEAAGYTPNILALGRFGGIQAGMPYAASNPITYYNADLFRRAGLNPDAFPTDWNGVFTAARAIRALGDGIEGLYYNWGGDDWMFSALLFGHGGTMLNADESDIAFAGPEGLAALRLLDRMVKEGGMPNFNAASSQQAFVAGKLVFVTTPEDPTFDYWSVPPHARAALAPLLDHPGLRLVASGHLHLHHHALRGRVAYAWAPPISFLVRPQDQPGLPGTRRTGALLHHLHEDHVETVLLAPEGMEEPYIHDIRHLTYPRPA